MESSVPVVEEIKISTTRKRKELTKEQIEVKRLKKKEYNKQYHERTKQQVNEKKRREWRLSYVCWLNKKERTDLTRRDQVNKRELDEYVRNLGDDEGLLHFVQVFFF